MFLPFENNEVDRFKVLSQSFRIRSTDEQFDDILEIKGVVSTKIIKHYFT